MALLRTLDDNIRISIGEDQTLFVGRVPECDVVLDDGSVSSQHARLSMKNHVLYLQDLESTNGTRVNYAIVDKPVVLLDGDTVEFGTVTFTVDAPELCSPGEDHQPPEALTSLEPSDEFDDLGNTMMIPNIELQDLDDPPPKEASPEKKVADPIQKTEAPLLEKIEAPGLKKMQFPVLEKLPPPALEKFPPPLVKDEKAKPPQEELESPEAENLDSESDEEVPSPATNLPGNPVVVAFAASFILIILGIVLLLSYINRLPTTF